MYVVSAVSAGKPFSVAVREAVERGYAEPDPRDDLSGADAARKALILARLLGYRGAGPTPDNLVPRALRHLPLPAFMDRLSSVDAEWKARVEREAAKGRVLRYVVSATPRGVSARLIRRSDFESDRWSARHAQSGAVHDEALLDRAARYQRSRRRRRGDGGGNSQRHLLAVGKLRDSKQT